MKPEQDGATANGSADAQETRKNAFLRIPATCPLCRAVFTPSRAWQRFCSASCRARHHRANNSAPGLKAWQEQVERRLAALEATAKEA